MPRGLASRIARERRQCSTSHIRSPTSRTCGSSSRPRTASSSASRTSVSRSAPGETVCVVGESGSGKSVSSLSLMRLVEFGGGEIAGGKLLFDRGGKQVDLRDADACADAHDPRQRDRHDLSGADDVAEPGLHRRPAADRGTARPHGHEPRGGRGARARAVAAGPDPRARAAAETISARAVAAACASASSSPWRWPASRAC